MYLDEERWFFKFYRSSYNLNNQDSGVISKAICNLLCNTAFATSLHLQRHSLLHVTIWNTCKVFAYIKKLASVDSREFVNEMLIAAPGVPASSRELGYHLWYLCEELVSISFMDECHSKIEKKTWLTASRETIYIYIY